MNCRDLQTQAVCLRAADGSKVSAVAHYEYGLDAEAVMLNASTRFTDATGEVVYNISDFEDVTVGDCAIAGVHLHCVQTNVEKKAGYSVSDFDPGDLEEGDPASCTFNVSVDDPSPIITIDPVPGYTFSDDGLGNFTASFIYDGSTSNPERTLSAQIKLSTGEVATLKGDDFYLCSGGGESLLLSFIGKATVKEICYKDCPSLWQDFEGNPLIYSDLLFCEEPKPKDRLITPECLVKRTIRVGYDNGLTVGSSTNDNEERPNLVRFNWNFTVLGWEVNGSQYGQGSKLESFAGWTPQLEGWAAFKTQFDPNVSDATFGVRPAPTWRYCDVITCDPRAIYGPIKMQREDGAIFDVYPVPSISTASYEYAYRYSKVDCDDAKTIVWCDAGGNEIPAPVDAECYVPCGFNFGPFINSADAPVCTEKVRDLCDQTDAGPIDFVLVITDCGGKRTRERWTTASYASATNPDELVPYVVVGQVINCDTGEPYVEPPLPCDDFEITELFSIQNKTPGARNREWEGPDNTPLPQRDIDAAREYVANYDYEANPPLVDSVVNTNIAAINDTNNSSTVLDFQIREFCIDVQEPFFLRFSANSEGSLIFEIGLCKGELEEVIALSKSVGAEDTNSTYIPRGIHNVRMVNIDNARSNTSWVAQTSADDVNYANNNSVFDELASTTQMYETCKKIKVCKPSGVMVGLLDGAEIDTGNCYECSIDCQPSSNCLTCG